MDKAKEEHRKMMEEVEREKAEFEARVAAQREKDRKKEDKEALLKTEPQIRNINADPSMSGMVRHPMKQGKNTVGKKVGDWKPNIKVSGAGIAKEQCNMEYDPDTRKTVIHPNSEDL
eukprot:CAMPEP_0116888576 /NCGR_PEP_ID=MMETSP0463-20121206/23672_1 /TAXON_ID=181622 /ORGANISM="Strombidinopsis sp, Strain SopsisLIS2011" /LENGTH=116 /DNA_ID=CAMNT_0004553627 /DNA_START=1095 /DNA_END=1445 /DNA_ORIENTATION=-